MDATHSKTALPAYVLADALAALVTLLQTPADERQATRHVLALSEKLHQAQYNSKTFFCHHFSRTASNLQTFRALKRIIKLTEKAIERNANVNYLFAYGLPEVFVLAPYDSDLKIITRLGRKGLCLGCDPGDVYENGLMALRHLIRSPQDLNIAERFLLHYLRKVRKNRQAPVKVLQQIFPHLHTANTWSEARKLASLLQKTERETMDYAIFRCNGDLSPLIRSWNH